jgi:hypothetical protein
MESEEIVYWMTLGVLAMATVTGVVTSHQGLGDRLADRSIAMISQASEKATSYAEMAGMVLGNGERDSARPRLGVVDVQNYIRTDVQNRLACEQRVLVRHQAETARLQSMRVQVRILERTPSTIVWPNPNIVIDIPQPPQLQVDTL